MTASAYKALRKSLGTQEAVAKMLGVTRETIAHRENGLKITKEAELAMRFLAENQTIVKPRKAESAKPRKIGVCPECGQKR